MGHSFELLNVSLILLKFLIISSWIFNIHGIVSINLSHVPALLAKQENFYISHQ